MIVLGLDPGTATTGFGVIEMEHDNLTLLDYGCITTEPNTPLAKRLEQIGKDVEKLIDMWHPDEISMEELFFSKNVKTAIHVSHARGSIMQTLSLLGYEIHEYKPKQIKEAVSGYGNADKKQVQKMVQIILGMDHLPKPDDAADALAAAICHLNQSHINSLVSA
jgi:crossover junction endodeoxyribonuclease RuvC